jgi:hypothetical protein
MLSTSEKAEQSGRSLLRLLQGPSIAHKTIAIAKKNDGSANR